MGRDHKLRSRQAGRKPTRPTALVVCEGEKTEPRYFEALRHHLRVGGITVQPMGKDPAKLIEAADDMRKRHARAGGARYDAVWVVFDTERPGTYANLPNLIQAAEKRDIRVALSCPCFEIWLLLHFDCSTGSCPEYRQVEAKLERHLPGYDKVRYAVEPLMTRLPTALEHARKLRVFHARAGGSGRFGNPGTDVDQLVSWIQSRLQG
jgi:hypothetical protein